MSILNDDRRVSDDLWEYSEWYQEFAREYRGANEYPDPPDDGEMEDDDEFVSDSY